MLHWHTTPGEPCCISLLHPWLKPRGSKRFFFLAAWQTLVRVWRQSFLNFAEVKQWLTGTMVNKKFTSFLTDTVTHTKFLNIWDPWINLNGQLGLDHSLVSDCSGGLMGCLANWTVQGISPPGQLQAYRWIIFFFPLPFRVFGFLFG